MKPITEADLSARVIELEASEMSLLARVERLEVLLDRTAKELYSVTMSSPNLHPRVDGIIKDDLAALSGGRGEK